MRTYVGYDKNNNRIQAYYIKSLNDLEEYMTIKEYKQIEYLKELKYDETTLNDDIQNWKYANTRKIYIHKNREEI